MTGNNIGFKRMDHLYRSYRASSIARMLADRVQSAEGILRNRLEIETGNPELWDVYSNKRRIKKRFKEHDRGGRPFERTGAMLVGDIRDIESDYEWSPFGDELLLPDDEGPWRPFGVMSCGRWCCDDGLERVQKDFRTIPDRRECNRRRISLRNLGGRH
jgi:hypothetical protein